MSECNGDPRWSFFCRGAETTLQNAGVRRLSALSTLESALAKEKQRLLAERPKVFLGMPSYSKTGTWDPAWQGFVVSPTDGENITASKSKMNSSLLAHSFNQLYAQAIFARNTQGVTHFAMIHTDVAPEANWLDVLWEELTAQHADILSAIIPIKSSLGLTSTAIDNSSDPWHPRRLTMTEIMELPETFGRQATMEAGFNPDGDRLLVNTGCWICDLRKDWVDAADDEGWLKCHFTIGDGIRANADGSYLAGVQPEDWTFSRMVQTVDPKARVLATRKVRVLHMGETGYPNDHAWGEWEHDEGTVAAEQPAEQPAEQSAEQTEVQEPVSQEELIGV
ncbi:hypothetical protein LCGC14_0325790 [marine sediment metagenome]|uniref:Uncharacterized protein n=1 Tax=marine sediment metagenome TaxID=412755 RepID=A0A0F9WPZ0_9ZZZZ